IRFLSLLLRTLALGILPATYGGMITLICSISSSARSRRGRQHVADRRDAPSLFSSLQHERRPHTPGRASGESRHFVSPVPDRHVGRHHPYGLHGDRALPSRTPRTRHRAADHLVTPPPPFA